MIGQISALSDPRATSFTLTTPTLYPDNPTSISWTVQDSGGVTATSQLYRIECRTSESDAWVIATYDSDTHVYSLPDTVTIASGSSVSQVTLYVQFRDTEPIPDIYYDLGSQTIDVVPWPAAVSFTVTSGDIAVGSGDSLTFTLQDADGKDTAFRGTGLLVLARIGTGTWEVDVPYDAATNTYTSGQDLDSSPTGEFTLYVQTLDVIPMDDVYTPLGSQTITVVAGLPYPANSPTPTYPSGDQVAGVGFQTTMQLSDIDGNIIQDEMILWQDMTYKNRFGSDETTTLVATFDSSTKAYTFTSTAVVHNLAQVYTTRIRAQANSSSASWLTGPSITVVAASPDYDESQLQLSRNAIPYANTDTAWYYGVTLVDEYGNPVYAETAVSAVFKKGSVETSVTMVQAQGTSSYYGNYSTAVVLDAGVWDVTVTCGSNTDCTTTWSSYPSSITISDPPAAVSFTLLDTSMTSSEATSLSFTLQDADGGDTGAAAGVELHSAIGTGDYKVNAFDWSTNSFSAEFTETLVGTKTFKVKLHDEDDPTNDTPLGTSSVTVLPGAPYPAAGPAPTYPQGSQTAGVSFDISMGLCDSQGNSISDEETLTLTYSTSGQADETVTASFDATSKVYTFTSPASVHNHAATWTTVIKTPANTDSASFRTGGSVTVVHATPSVSGSTITVPTSPVEAGNTVAVSASLVDAYGNTVDSISGVNVSAVFTMGTQTLSGAFIGANFTCNAPTGVSETAGVWSVALAIGSDTSSVTETVTVIPAEPDSTTSSLTVPTVDLVAGTTFEFAAVLRDAYGNTCTEQQVLKMEAEYRVGSQWGSTERTMAFNPTTYAYTITCPSNTCTTAAAWSVSLDIDRVSFMRGYSYTVVAAGLDVTECELDVPDSPVVAGTPVSVAVGLYDAYGNAKGEETVSVSFTAPGESPVSFSATYDEREEEYYADTTDAVHNTPGVYSVSAVVGSDPSFLTDSVTVIVGAPDAVESSLDLPASDVVAGTPFSVGATLRDACGNLITAEKTLSVQLSYDVSGVPTGVDETEMVFDSPTSTYSFSKVYTVATLWQSAFFLVEGGTRTLLANGDNVYVVPAAAAATKSTMSVPQGEQEAGTSFDVTLSLRDEYRNKISQDTVTVSFTPASGAPVPVPAVYSAVTGLYTATSLASVHNTAGVYTVEATVSGVHAFATDTVSVKAAPADPVSSTVTPTTSTRPRRSRSSVFSVAVQDSYGNPVTSTVSASKAVSSVVVSVEGDGWMSSGVAMYDAATSLYMADVTMEGSGTARVFLTIDGVRAQHGTLDVARSYFSIVLVIVCLAALVAAAVVGICFWRQIVAWVQGDRKTEESKADCTIPQAGESLPQPLPVLVVPVEQIDPMPMAMLPTTSTVALMPMATDQVELEVGESHGDDESSCGIPVSTSDPSNLV
ncbi:hypothetical protein KIPB_004099 [Kipferlia bialata]|uniref:Uncharacterized protein n=1 Tax=Kipferlia bialata TaxID=797122 RepID=A0A391NVP3_9EUKA|nr:hypothetical protein KIPB_004099 [Kipferlia bialata]|eukprot:g4099.t1